MFEYYAMNSEPYQFKDINKYLLSICNKTQVDSILKRRKPLPTPMVVEKPTRTCSQFREKYPSLRGAKYKYFQAIPKRQEVRLSTLQNDRSKSSIKLNLNSILKDNHILNETQGFKTQRVERVTTLRKEESMSQYTLPKCDLRWIQQLRNKIKQQP